MRCRLPPATCDMSATASRSSLPTWCVDWQVGRNGRFDLVLAGGLFDYLPDRVAIAVLRTACQRLLNPGGRVLFTNIGCGNAYRTWIEYMAEWFLIHRSETEVVDLCRAAGFESDAIEVESDRTGLTLVVGAGG